MDVTSSLRSLLPYGRRSIGISQLIAKLEGYLPPAEIERVQDAYDFAFSAHQGQRRRSGEPYITHPVAVADLLADLRLGAALELDLVELAHPVHQFGHLMAEPRGDLVLESRRVLHDVVEDQIGRAHV